jgi:thioesterase domain-containing protein
MLAGGDVLAVAQVKRFVEEVGGCRMINGYGPTENTTFTSCYEVEGVEEGMRSIPIGRPVSNTRVYVLDEQMQEVPMGVKGELYTGGEGLARGYINRAEMTAERFVPSPYGRGERLYRSGDQARYLTDGNIEFMGRNDEQVKIRGYRIEAGEVEAALRRQAGVAEAVVVVQQQAGGDKRLAGYVVAQEQQAVTGEGLRKQLREELPEYMIPAVIMRLEEIPLTANGKVDRRALPEAQWKRGEGRHYKGPRTITEEVLAGIWGELLCIEQIGIDDNFFEIGGHSLLAVRLMSRVQQQMGRSLPLASLFQGPTIEYQARLLRQEVSLDLDSPLVTIEQGGSKRPFFCVHPVSGNVFCYTALARHLGTDRPFYAFKSPDLDRTTSSQRQISEMASRYIDALRSAQPEGPYLLGGWSMGGNIAFEMARQLEAQGEEIALLALFDSKANHNDGELVNGNRLALLASFARDMGLSFEGFTLFEDELQRLDTDEQLGRILERAKLTGIVPPDLGMPQIRSLLNVFETNTAAIRSHEPKLYGGRVTLFSAADNPESDSQLGWGEFAASGVDLNVIPGDHYTIMREPNVEALAERLIGCIQQTEEA